MVVLSEKDLGLVPPPPYFAIENTHDYPISKSSSSATPRDASSIHPPSSKSTARPTRRHAPSLPSHILLLIVYSTLPRLGEYRSDKATGVRMRESSAEFAVRTTRTLYWMAFCLRGVNRGLYLAAMHILRSTLLPHYMQLVRPPYSSDPFPHTSVSPHYASEPSGVGSSSGLQTPVSVVSSMQCESEVLDRYILHQLHEDVFADDSSLHIARPETLRDLFDFMQPRARLTDLVRAYGVGAGLVTFSDVNVEMVAESENEGDVYEIGCASNGRKSSDVKEKNTSVGMSLKAKMARSTSMLTLVNSPPPPSPTPTCAFHTKFGTYAPHSLPTLGGEYHNRGLPTRKRKKIHYAALRVSFSPRRVGLVYTAPVSGKGIGGSGPKTIVDLPRVREEPLERSASRLVAGLKAWMDGVVVESH